MLLSILLSPISGKHFLTLPVMRYHDLLGPWGPYPPRDQSTNSNVATEFWGLRLLLVLGHLGGSALALLSPCCWLFLSWITTELLRPRELLPRWKALPAQWIQLPGAGGWDRRVIVSSWQGPLQEARSLCFWFSCVRVGTGQLLDRSSGHAHNLLGLMKAFFPPADSGRMPCWYVLMNYFHKHTNFYLSNVNVFQVLLTHLDVGVNQVSACDSSSPDLGWLTLQTVLIWWAPHSCAHLP